MLNDLTPEEIVALVLLLEVAESSPGIAMFITPQGKFTTLEHFPGVMSLAEKINQAGNREDVKKYIDESYSTDTQE